MSTPPRPRDRGDFEIAIICALTLEANAVIALFDKHWDDNDDDGYGNAPGDPNAYTTGVIGRHNVVLAHMPGMGMVSAATVASGLRTSFQNLSLALVVGICGGIPYSPHGQAIFLGDVIISRSLIQYDFGRQYPGSFERKNTLEDCPGRAPVEIRSILKQLETDHHRDRMQNSTRGIIQSLQQYLKHPGIETDKLFDSKYLHQHRESEPCACHGANGMEICSVAAKTGCNDLGCDEEKLVRRRRAVGGHSETEASALENPPSIHIGLIGCGDAVMKSGVHRDTVARNDQIIALEMEGVGVWDFFPSLVIKGVCDYADSHKNKQWQDYAAAVAAACTKAFLNRWTSKGEQRKIIYEFIPNDILKPASTSIDRIFSVPFERDKQFVGRQDILLQIDQALSANHRVALHGWGGLGKSQIAIEYCYRYRATHPEAHVFWVYSANAARFEQGFKDTSRGLKLPYTDNPEVDPCEIVFNWLNKDNSEQWLMVLDNADDADLFYWTAERESQGQNRVTKKPPSEYLPRTLDSKRKIIITTRNRQLGEGLSHEGPCIDIRPFSLSEARSLLRLKASDASACESDTNIDKLLQVLGCIPLAITQAASFIRQRRIPISKYLGLLVESEQNLKESLTKELRDHRREPGFANAVFPTWKISYDQIREQHPRAAAMVSFMSMLDRQHIPQTLLRNQTESDFDFFEAVGILDNFSLITREIEKDGLALHRLVQLSVHLWLENCRQKEQFELEALTLISSRFPTGQHKNRSTCELLLPHAQSVLQGESGKKVHKTQRVHLLYNMSWFEWQQGRYDESYAKVFEAYKIAVDLYETAPEETWRIRTLMALVLRYQGKYEEAEQINRQTLEGQVKMLGKEHPDTLTSVNNLTLTLRYQGKYEEAEQINRRALEGREKTLGEKHPDTLTSVNNLAPTLQYQGKYEEVEQLNRRALEGQEKTLGKEHPDTLTSVNNLALILQYQGKYEEAEQLNRRALEGQEKTLGKEHPDTLTSFSNLAVTLQYQGKYEEAEQLDRRALEGREKTLGKKHPDTLTSVNNLALILQYQGKYEEAEQLNRRALEGQEKMLGKEHPDTLISFSNLASTLQGQEKYEEAEQLNRRALEGQEKTLGKEHPDTLTSVNNLALILQYQRKYEEAEQLNRRALEGQKKTLGKKHPDTLTSFSNLALTLQYQEKYEEAEQLNRRALKGREKTMRKEHPDTLISVSNLASTLRYQGKYEEAEQLNRRALEGQEKTLGKEHPDTLTNFSNLALTLQNQGKYEEAEQLDRRTLKGQEKTLGKEHPDTLTSVNNLALILQYQGKYEEAEQLNRRALERSEKVLGKEHPHTLTSLYCSAYLYHQQKRYDTAFELYQRACDGYKRILGPEHPETIECCENYLKMKSEMGLSTR